MAGKPRASRAKRVTATPELALKLIEENKRTKSPFLDLGNCGLTEFPPELAALPWLETLVLASIGSRDPVGHLSPLSHLTAPRMFDVSDAQVADLSPLAHLTALQTLDVSGTQVADLSPLAHLTALQSIDVSRTQVADLSPLAHLTALQTLYASGTQVADLSPLAHLTALQTLYVSYTQVADLSPLAHLTALQTLNVLGTYVADLSPLAQHLTALQTLDVSYTQVADLSPLAHLTAPQTLDVSGTQVADLSPLAHLTALQTLGVSRTQVADLSPLAHLTALQTLDVSGTQVADLSPLAHLTALQTLNVSGTRVADLSPLAHLTALQTLNVSNSRVADLSALVPLLRRGMEAEWSDRYWSGPGIYLLDCPLTNPPAEIVLQGNEAILNYFEERKAGVDHLYEAKMLILGKGGSGKTSLLRRLYYPKLPLPEPKETTKGIDIHRQDFPLPNGKQFRLNVWDFGGQQIYHATHQFFLTKRSIYVLVDDTREDNKSVSDEGFKYWLDLVEVFGGGSPVLIFQNEKGGRSKAIDFEGIQARYPNVRGCYTGNLEAASSANELRDAIARFASNLEHIGEELPTKWIQVRADIETRAAETPHITQDEYFGIYSRHLDFDRTKALYLSRYLHDLGVFLHFQDDPLLTHTVVLQNQWATHAVFKVLDDEDVKGRGGRFGEADCKRVWRDSIYAHMHSELLALMKNFELCYELRDSRPAAWLATQLLSPNRPPQFLNWAMPSDLILRYRYTFLPKGILSRLTVRLHRFLSDPANAWRTGVLFERGGTQVLTELLPEGNDIELRARGLECKELLSVVSSDLDALNDSFDGLKGKVDKLIPCICPTCARDQKPYFFEQKDLLRRKEKGQRTAECGNSYDAVEVRELLDGMKIEELPGWAKETPLKPIRIFLASSAELREDRDVFDLFVQRRNAELYKKGFVVIVDRWESFLDAMSVTRLQDEYNKAVRNSDIFVSLFSTKVGKFTKEEFEVAYGQFKSTAKPRIYTYFKDAATTMASVDEEGLRSLRAFQQKLRALGHFHIDYKNLDALKLHFSEQLEKLLQAPH